MADEKKSSFLGDLVDKVKEAPSKFIDGMVQKGREGMEKTIAEQAQKDGLSADQVQEKQDRTARNARLKNTMGQ